jgi:hypothetical protein
MTEPHSAANRALLTAVLDTLIPAEPPWPAAGALGCAEAIEQLARDSDTRWAALAACLAAIRELSGPTGFDALDPARREALLVEAESALSAQFSLLVELAYSAYYLRPEVHAACGYQGPPQPLGYTLPPLDPDRLTRQRRKPPLWRPAPD